MTRFAVLASLLLGLAGCSACAWADVPGRSAAQRAAETGPPQCYIEFNPSHAVEYELRTTRGRPLGRFRSIDDAWRAASLYDCPVTIDPTIDP